MVYIHMLRKTGMQVINLINQDAATVQGTRGLYNCRIHEVPWNQTSTEMFMLAKEEHEKQYEIEKNAIVADSALSVEQKEDALGQLKDKYFALEALIKEGKGHGNKEHVGEVLVAKICESICDETTNFSYVPYDMVSITYPDGRKAMGNSCPVSLLISKQLDGGRIHEEHSNPDFGHRKNDNPNEQDYYHTIDGYSLMLNEIYNSGNDPRIKAQIDKAMTQMKKMSIMDYLTCQSDRHFGNYGFSIDEETNDLQFSPMYDMGNCFGLGERGGQRPFGIDRTIFEILNPVVSKLPNCNQIFGKLFDKNGILDKVGLHERGGILAPDAIPLLGIKSPLMIPERFGRHPRFPKYDKNMNPPRNAVLENNELIVDSNDPEPRIMTSSDKKLMMETYENEIAEMIVEDPELANFYRKARSINMSQILEEVNTLAGPDRLDPEQCKKIMKQWNDRVYALDSKCKFLNNEFLEQPNTQIVSPLELER